VYLASRAHALGKDAVLFEDCINPAATIGTMNKASAVLAADESSKSVRELVFHIVGESTRNVT
jgi:hypothetical protein